MPTVSRTLRSVSRATTALRGPTTPRRTPALLAPSILGRGSRQRANVPHVLRDSTVRLPDCRHQQAVVRRDISASREHRQRRQLMVLQEIYVLWDPIVRQAPTTQHHVLQELTAQLKVMTGFKIIEKSLSIVIGWISCINKYNFRLTCAVELVHPTRV